jgi:hypothetical protein
VHFACIKTKENEEFLAKKRKTSHNEHPEEEFSQRTRRYKEHEGGRRGFLSLFFLPSSLCVLLFT